MAFFNLGLGLLCLASTSIAGLFALGLQIRRDKSALSNTVSALLFCVAIYLGLAAGRYALTPAPLPAPLPWLTILALGGALIFRLFVQLAQLATERRPKTWWPLALLIPALASDILVHGFSLQSHYSNLWPFIISTLHVLTGVGVLAFCLAALIHVFRLFSFKTMTRLGWLVFTFSGSGVVSLSIGLLGLLIGNAWLYAVAEAYIALTIIAGALLSFRWPDLFDQFHTQAVKARYARSALADFDVEGLIAGMMEMVTKTALFRQADCSLNDLSKRMGLTRHQVSELLNDHMGTSFTAFINGFRLKAAKELLISRPELTVLAVAIDAGFGNKTSFNECFRRAEGCTPSQFRRRYPEKTSR